MVKLLLILFLFGFIYFIYWIIKKTAVKISPEAQEVLARSKNVYYTNEFKVPKRLKDGDSVKLYSVPNSSKVNFYESNTYAGEGYLSHEVNSKLWQIVDQSKYKSAVLIKSKENSGYLKIQLV